MYSGMSASVRLLLVAKPWKGGLAQYIFGALNDLFPGQVSWLPTYPATFKDHLAYRRDKARWLSERVGAINRTAYDCAIFINHIPAFRDLDPSRCKLLWITDAPRLIPGDDLPFERIYLSDPGYEPELLAASDPARYRGELPFALHPRIHRPAPGLHNSQGICFIGNKDPKRDMWLSALIATGLYPQVYGNYFLRHPLFWRHPGLFRPPLHNRKMGWVYGRHGISLNIHAQVVRAGTNMRTFECAGYGIPQVVEYRPGIEKFFQHGQDILLAHTPQDMTEHVNWLHKYPANARRLAENARLKALTQHTYYHRIQAMLDGLIPITRIPSIE